MKFSSPIAAIVCSLLLHGVVIALILSALTGRLENPAVPLPLTAKFVVVQPLMQPVVADNPPVKKEPTKLQTTRIPMPRPASPPARETAVTASIAAESPSESLPAVAINAPVAPVAASQAPPVAPAPVVKTGVSISATYAASNRKPVYPTLSKRYGEQGTVMLRVLVQADGSAGKIEIHESSGYSLLDEAAQTAVQTWRFNPATIDGKAIAKWYQVPIPFTLQN